MNISRRKGRRLIIDYDDDDDDDVHIYKNENIHEDMVSSSSHNIDGYDLIMEILLRLPPIQPTHMMLMNKNENIHHDDIVCSSHNNIDGDDMIMEILLRLPPISVDRFRRVCNQWYTLISNTYFLRTHSSPSSPFQLHNNNSSTTPHSTHDHLLLVFYKFRVYDIIPKVGFVPLTQFQEQEVEVEVLKDYHRKTNPASLIKLCHGFSPPGDDYNLIDSCNGLFLFHNNINLDGAYSICNPITKHFIKLPDIPAELLEEENLESSLVCSTQANLVFDHHHPAKMYLSYKIIKLLLRYRYWQIYVYSSQTDSWRLLSTRITHPIGLFKSVYSSLTGSWRLLSINEDAHNFLMGERGLISLLLNGVLYFSYWISNEDASVCFDVEKECVWFLPLPPKPENSVRNCLYFGECGGRVRLVERFLDTSEPGWENGGYILPCCFDIMEMESHQQPQQQQQDGVNCVWTVKYRVDITRVFDLFNGKRATVIHCCETKNRQINEEEVLLLRLSDGSIVSFNLTSNKIIKKIVNPERTQVYDFGDVFAFTPTLYPFS